MGFTRTLKGLVNEIITEAAVSQAYNPKTEGTPPPFATVKGLWDTGATGSSITLRLAKKLGLMPVGKAQVHHAGGTSFVNVYLINVVLPNQVGFSYVKVSECEETVGRFDLLIGMDLITKGDFAISNTDGKTTISFRTPSVKAIQLEKDCLPNNSKITHHNGKPVIDPNTGRNALCPCGSGKKYKHCHAKTTP